MEIQTPTPTYFTLDPQGLPLLITKDEEGEDMELQPESAAGSRDDVDDEHERKGVNLKKRTLAMKIERLMMS